MLYLSDGGTPSAAESVVIHPTPTPSPQPHGKHNKDGVVGEPLMDNNEEREIKNQRNGSNRSTQKKSKSSKKKKKHLQSPKKHTQPTISRAHSDPIESKLYSEEDNVTTSNPQLRHTQSLIESSTKKNKNGRPNRPRLFSRNISGNTNVAYMGDGTIFQHQKQKINKLKLEIQTEQQNLQKLSNQLQM
eukprot:172707_1